MTKYIRQQKMYVIGNSFYILVPKDVRDEAKITQDTTYRFTYNPKTNEISIKFLEDT